MAELCALMPRGLCTVLAASSIMELMGWPTSSHTGPWWWEEGGGWGFHAIRDIQAGEELLYDYGAGHIKDSPGASHHYSESEFHQTINPHWLQQSCNKLLYIIASLFKPIIHLCTTPYSVASDSTIKTDKHVYFVRVCFVSTSITCRKTFYSKLPISKAISLTALNQFLWPQHFKMESIHTLKDIIKPEIGYCSQDRLEGCLPHSAHTPHPQEIPNIPVSGESIPVQMPPIWPIMVPAHLIVFLGLTINTKSMILSLPAEKWRYVTENCNRATSPSQGPGTLARQDERNCLCDSDSSTFLQTSTEVPVPGPKPECTVLRDTSCPLSRGLGATSMVGHSHEELEWQDPLEEGGPLDHGLKCIPNRLGRSLQGPEDQRPLVCSREPGAHQCLRAVGSHSGHQDFCQEPVRSLSTTENRQHNSNTSAQDSAMEANKVNFPSLNAPMISSNDKFFRALMISSEENFIASKIRAPTINFRWKYWTSDNQFPMKSSNDQFLMKSSNDQFPMNWQPPTSFNPSWVRKIFLISKNILDICLWTTSMRICCTRRNVTALMISSEE